MDLQELSAKLLEFAGMFLKEDFRMQAAEYDKGRGHDSNERISMIDSLASEAKDKVGRFEERLKELSLQALDVAGRHGLQVEDFSYGAGGFMGNVRKYTNGEIEAPGARLIAAAKAKPADWFPAKTRSTMEAAAIAACSESPGLDSLLQQIVAHCDYLPQYMTAKIIRNNIGVMKIFDQIYKRLGEYLKGNNIMLLGETSQALNKMIAGSDTPFIYERVGSWLDHYLLDEFQDFSKMQWANFKPLLEQSLAAGNGNMIVGDVKQSIYRWRDSDWNTLYSGVEEAFDKNLLSLPPMNVNYRSDKEIVDFNNMVFEQLSSAANAYFDGDETIAKAYEGCRQEMKHLTGGHVRVVYYDKSKGDAENYALASLKGDIESLLERDYRKRDIYILVRKNSEAQQVAERLIADNIDVISGESLYVGNSTFVQKIVAVLKHIVNKDDAINNIVLSELGIDPSSTDTEGNSLYDICENIIRSLGTSTLGGQMPYLMAFLDLIMDYMRDSGSDIAGFIKWWDESGSKQTISEPEGADAVHILTIHKAKGLSCPVTIVPLFNEQLSPSGFFSNWMWCDDKSSDLKAGLVPVKHGSEAGMSTFAADNELETRNYKMDALNTAYVAFTRAKHELLVYSVAPYKGKPASVSDKLYQLLCGCGMKDVEDGVAVYEAGEPTLKKEDKKTGRTVASRAISDYKSVPMEGNAPADGSRARKRLRLVFRGADFFEEGQSSRERGIVLHDILSRIITDADIKASVDVAVASGELPEENRPETESLIEELIASVQKYRWFNNNVTVLNEVSIIDTSGTVHRPDRVILDGRRAVVVDYKFGTHHGSYRNQVAQYMDLLRGMGYEQVEGYLWYAAENKIEKVA